MNLTFERKILKLKETFSISYGNFDFREALLVTLEDQGIAGYGECVAISYYGIDLHAFEVKLTELKILLLKVDNMHPKDFHSWLLTKDLHPFLLSALDCAYWDLYGKIEGKTFAELNSIPTHKMPQSSYTISIGDVEEQILKINGSEWNSFKVKCSRFDLIQIKELLKTNKKICLDANASFSAEDCRILSESELAAQLEYVEQPMKIGDYYTLSRSGAVNWMADEDCQEHNSLSELLPHYRSLNIKLMKTGGLTPALQMIGEAKKLGYKIMIGCMTESSVGISAGIALASLCDYADLDGASLIANDYASGSYVHNGLLRPSSKIGLGIELI